MFTSLSRSASAVAAVLTASALLVAAAGCSATSSPTAGSGISAASGTDPVAGRPTPVANPDKKKVKIAIVDFPSQVAEVFKASEAGASRAGQVLAAYNVQVDYLPVTTISADGVNQVVRTAMNDGYDAIAVTLLGAANCAPMKEAVAKGIKVAAIMSSADCVEGTGALFYHGEDSLAAWTAIGKQMAEATGTEPCTAGVVTGFFSAPQHEARREGLLAGIAGSHLTAVGKGVEAGVDPAKYQAAARDYVTANPDLCAILITTGDNGAAASTLTAEQAAKIKVISSDLTSGTRKQIEAGKQYAAVEQDPFGSTYDSSIWLYNAVITGNGPEGGFNQPVKNLIVTKANLEEALRMQTEGA
ncbi:substrate-binding domain-containing protein [Propionicimonas sp.]|uniref:sugar ABC transporter substrate-binding protein n=1 Tax=Propionicimonas sp. TaxID=1955623 RepID=UPI0017D4FF09|nr:substrate-binding domain-containing protein [Propionicimonas sp.]MBU3976822.1 substrate-binding domain-containing protein [Actinomycetota bacterium]MBA3019511.1 sugar ABC transporter substrate-binding protein [Propionicimonas sp.]MBU3986917.1 substrate-binding domain-containing protein [Actinomycetota bacterium]MBU4006829.1 substrate-binding domain-containing protein [Actinomycetota bacterium]MBU4065529.1 substrate-binding domain-containing protein [Actinomycetota bacterium]